MLLCVGRSEGLEKRGESRGQKAPLWWGGGTNILSCFSSLLMTGFNPINLCRLGQGREERDKG